MIKLTHALSDGRAALLCVLDTATVRAIEIAGMMGARFGGTVPPEHAHLVADFQALLFTERQAMKEAIAHQGGKGRNMGKNSSSWDVLIRNSSPAEKELINLGDLVRRQTPDVVRVGQRLRAGGGWTKADVAGRMTLDGLKRAITELQSKLDEYTKHEEVA